MTTDTAGELSGWTFVARLDEIPKGRKRCFTAGEHSVVVCRVYDEVFTVKNLCPHLNQALTDGRLQEYELTCPFHNACFDVRDGKPLAGPSVWPLETYQSRVIDGDIYIRPVNKNNSETQVDPRLKA